MSQETHGSAKPASSSPPSEALDLTLKKVEEYGQQHNCELYVAKMRLGNETIVLAFKYPSESQFRFVLNEQSQDFMSKASPSDENQGDQYAAKRNILTECCVEPGINKLNELILKRPGLVPRLWTKLEKAVTPDLEEIKN